MRVMRLAFRIGLAGAFVLVVLYAVSTLVSRDCETELCCQDCRTLSVTRIVDGDTFVSQDRRVRLFGIDTPEVGERCSRQATERLSELAGSAVRVEAGPRPTDFFGRRLFYAYTEAGESIDETMVREGLAHAWTIDGQHRDFLVSLETAARLSGTGCLW